jgi:hypothetical protein
VGKPVMLRNFCLLVILSGAFASPQTPSAPAIASQQAAPQPTTPLDWFRRADNLTNIRLPESLSFHMKVAFHAFPGYDFTKPNQSTILTGDGTYEETWVSPQQWRREVTLGSYHAVEVRADGVRKLQASSDYEPSRVLMMMSALLYPMPRYLLDPEIQGRHIKWKLEHLTAGTLPYVSITFTENLGQFGLHPRSYDFLPSGVLVRSEDYNGLMASWQGQAVFGGKLVPRHFEVQGAGLEGPMLTADVSIEALGNFDAALFRIPGEAADPGMTLRPFDDVDLEVAPPIHLQIPERWNSAGHSMDVPPEVQIYTIAVIDRQGVPREAEMSGIRRFGRPVSPAQFGALATIAQHAVESLWKDRYHPTLIDGKPCQFIMSLAIWTTPTIN